MDFEIKKEDPLNYLDFNHEEPEFDDEDSNDFDQTSSSSNLPQTSTRPAKKQNFPSTIQMPTKDEIMCITDLNWKIALQRHLTTHELRNDSRSKIAKLIIKNCYERKFETHGHYDLKLTRDNFQQLAETLVEIFPTEVTETYFLRSIKGRAASGKLYNAFVNTRAEIIDVGLLEVNRRGTNKSGTVKESRQTAAAGEQPEIVDRHPDAFEICLRSDGFDDPEQLTEMWDYCYEHRQQQLRHKSAQKYFNLFPYLKESDGYKLLVSDANRRFCYCEQIDRFELITSKIFERAQRLFKGESIPRTMIQNYLDSADPVVLGLILLPFLFTNDKKRSFGGNPKVTKQDMYHGFFPHFPSLTELEDFENTISFSEKPLHTCVVGNLADRPYSIVRLFNTKYHFGSPREAMNVAFRIFLALNLDFPYESLLMWVFLKKFVFRVKEDEDAKLYPQVETMINEFNLYLSKKV